ncbi:uncharacterized protein [Euwallacea similis]|uniref:uncharacterized protein n=1 Tax=Euwallacea similis TaxID=1736056 RepID=UPI00344E3FCA
MPAYVATAESAIIMATDYNFSSQYPHTHHQVKEQVGTTYMAFYLCPTSPYKKALKDFTLKSLAYGSFSKNWGLYYRYWTEPKHNAQKLQMKHMLGLFITWSIGMMLGSLVFALEITWHRSLMLNRVYEFMN